MQRPIHDYVVVCITTILVLMVQSFNAQTSDNCTFQLSGRIYDRTNNEPLPQASIFIKGANLGIASDLNGYFLVENLCEEEFDIEISYIGYQTLTHHHDFHHPDIEVYLSPTTLLLESVVIEERRNSSGLEAITTASLSTEEMHLAESESLGEILSRLSGINTVRAGQNVITPMIHGLSGNRILIVNNDVRHEYQNWDNDHAPEIDPSALQSVEVIKGAGTVRYGADALGGVIVIEPRKVELSSDLDISMNVTGKSNGRSLEGGMELAKGFNSIALHSTVSILKQGDLSAPDYTLTNTGKRELSFANQLQFHLSSRIDLRVAQSHFDQELGILRGAVNGNLDDLLQALEAKIPNQTMPFGYDIKPPRQRVIHDAVKMELQYLDNRQSAILRYSFQHNSRREYDIRRDNDFEIPNIDVVLESHIVDAEWTYPSVLGLTGKLGFQFRYSDNANQPGTNTVPFIPNYRSNTLGLFAIGQRSFGNHLVEAGLRLDQYKSNIAGRTADNMIYRNEIEYTNVSASVGWNVNLSDHVRFSSNIGSAWRPPSIGELYRFGRRGTSIEYGLWRYQVLDDNKISTSEVLTQDDRRVDSEIGIKWINTLSLAKHNWYTEFNVFVNRIDNYLYIRPAGLSRTIRGAAPLFIYNQTDVWFMGADIAARHEHSPRIQSDIRASYLWADQIGTDGIFAGIPPARIFYGLTYRPKSQWLSEHFLKLDLSYTFKQGLVPRIISVEELLQSASSSINVFINDNSDFDITDSPSGFFLTDLAWSASVKNLSWTLRIQNIWNTRYRHYTDRTRYFADDVGRNFSLSLTWKI